MVELWIGMLLYGGGRMDDLRLLSGRGLRRLFGWRRCSTPRLSDGACGEGASDWRSQLDEVLWQIVRARLAQEGIPGAVMLVLDSMVIQRYGLQQVAAENGVQPDEATAAEPYPLVAVLVEIGDCMGARW
jgi:hypothetical protein